MKIIRITDLDAPDLQVYAHLNENQLRHYYEPLPEGIFIAESPNVVARTLDAGYEPISLLLEEKYVETEAKSLIERIRDYERGRTRAGSEPGGNARDRNVEQQGTEPRERQPVQAESQSIPIYVSTLDVLSRITGYHLTRGILGAFRRKAPRSVEEVLRNCRRIAVLENVENPTNVGAIFRSAAALGMDAVLITPECADPLQRRAIRVSVGTVFQVPWTYIGTELTPAHARALGIPAAGRDNNRTGNGGREHSGSGWPDRGMEELHRLGFATAAMALRDDTTAIDDSKLREINKLAVVLGNEGDGLTEHTIAACDYTIKIPMSHGVDSLNVAAASAVAFWELGRRGQDGR